MTDNESERMRRHLVSLREVVDQQAEDPGLWFLCCTASEAYLQQELRRLHAAIEEWPEPGRVTRMGGGSGQ